MWDLIVSVPDHCLSFSFTRVSDTYGNECNHMFTRSRSYVPRFIEGDLLPFKPIVGRVKCCFAFLKSNENGCKSLTLQET